jgi:hypothetical protein
MRRRPAPTEIALGLALRLLLDRLASRRDSAAAAPQRARGRGTASAPSAGSSVRRRPLLVFMLASLAVGLVLMLVFHAPVTRIVGVAALFAFIVSGVFLIADPAFLGQDEDPRSLERRTPG